MERVCSPAVASAGKGGTNSQHRASRANARTSANTGAMPRDVVFLAPEDTEGVALLRKDILDWLSRLGVLDPLPDPQFREVLAEGRIFCDVLGRLSLALIRRPLSRFWTDFLWGSFSSPNAGFNAVEVKRLSSAVERWAAISSYCRSIGLPARFPQPPHHDRDEPLLLQALSALGRLAAALDEPAPKLAMMDKVLREDLEISKTLQASPDSKQGGALTRDPGSNVDLAIFFNDAAEVQDTLNLSEELFEAQSPGPTSGACSGTNSPSLFADEDVDSDTSTGDFASQHGDQDGTHQTSSAGHSPAHSSTSSHVDPLEFRADLGWSSQTFERVHRRTGSGSSHLEGETLSTWSKVLNIESELPKPDFDDFAPSEQASFASPSHSAPQLSPLPEQGGSSRRGSLHALRQADNDKDPRIQARPAGVQSASLISDSWLSASSYAYGQKPAAARLKGPSSWAPIHSTPDEWLQVDLGRVGLISKVATQGDPTTNRWITGFTLEVSIDGNSWVTCRRPATPTVDCSNDSRSGDDDGNDSSDEKSNPPLTPTAEESASRFETVNRVTTPPPSSRKSSASGPKRRLSLSLVTSDSIPTAPSATLSGAAVLGSGATQSAAGHAALSQEVTSFEGNFDGFTIVETKIAPVSGRFVRIRPVSWHRGIALRWEIFWQPFGVLAGLQYNEARVTLSASSERDHLHAAGAARLFGPNAWIPHAAAHKLEFLEIDLGRIEIVSCLLLQGAGDDDGWVTSFYLATSIDGSTWCASSDFDSASRAPNTPTPPTLYKACRDSDTVCSVPLFLEPIARFLRIFPHGFVTVPALRAEVLCRSIGRPASLLRPTVLQASSSLPGAPPSAASLFSGAHQGSSTSPFAFRPRHAAGYDLPKLGDAAPSKSGRATRANKTPSPLASKKTIPSSMNDVREVVGRPSFSRQLSLPASSPPRKAASGSGPVSALGLAAPVVGVNVAEWAEDCATPLTSTESRVMGAWAPAVSDGKQYLEIDLGRIMVIKAVLTTGCAESQDWVTRFTLASSLMGTEWQVYRESADAIHLFEGNKSEIDIKINVLQQPLVARFIRLNPTSWHGNIALCAELFVAAAGTPLGLSSVPLGVGSSRIRSLLSASSCFSEAVKPEHARLHGPQAWAPAPNSLAQPYLEVLLDQPALIHAVLCQGSGNALSERAFVTRFWLEGSLQHTAQRASDDAWLPYMCNGSIHVFSANSDADSVVVCLLEPPLLASSLRLWPTAWHSRPALRIELLAEAVGSASGIAAGTIPDRAFSSSLTAAAAEHATYTSASGGGSSQASSNRSSFLAAYEPSLALGRPTSPLCQSVVSAAGSNATSPPRAVSPQDSTSTPLPRRLNDVGTSSQHAIDLPHLGRLFSVRDSWQPALSGPSALYNTYLEIDLQRPFELCALLLQGNPRTRSFVSMVSLQYSLSGDEWYTYTETNGASVFRACTNSEGVFCLSLLPAGEGINVAGTSRIRLDATDEDSASALSWQSTSAAGAGFGRSLSNSSTMTLTSTATTGNLCKPSSAPSGAIIAQFVRILPLAWTGPLDLRTELLVRGAGLPISLLLLNKTLAEGLPSLATAAISPSGSPVPGKDRRLANRLVRDAEERSIEDDGTAFKLAACASEVSTGGIRMSSSLQTRAVNPPSPRISALFGLHCWTPAVRDRAPFLSFEFGQPCLVRALATQGNASLGQWCTAYVVLYQLPGGGPWRFVCDSGGMVAEFCANSNGDVPVFQVFESPLAASALRIHPIAFHRAAALRADIFAESLSLLPSHSIFATDSEADKPVEWALGSTHAWRPKPAVDYIVLTFQNLRLLQGVVIAECGENDFICHPCAIAIQYATAPGGKFFSLSISALRLVGGQTQRGYTVLFEEAVACTALRISLNRPVQPGPMVTPLMTRRSSLPISPKAPSAHLTSSGIGTTLTAASPVSPEQAAATAFRRLALQFGVLDHPWASALTDADVLKLTCSSAVGIAPNAFSELSAVCGGRGWRARDEDNVAPFVEIRLKRPVHLRALLVQGCELLPAAWTRAFELAFSLDGDSWKLVRDSFGNVRQFAANEDASTPRLVDLSIAPPLVRHLRIFPVDWHHLPALRLELIVEPALVCVQAPLLLPANRPAVRLRRRHSSFDDGMPQTPFTPESLGEDAAQCIEGVLSPCTAALAKVDFTRFLLDEPTFSGAPGNENQTVTLVFARLVRLAGLAVRTDHVSPLQGLVLLLDACYDDAGRIWEPCLAPDGKTPLAFDISASSALAQSLFFPAPIVVRQLRIRLSPALSLDSDGSDGKEVLTTSDPGLSLAIFRELEDADPDAVSASRISLLGPGVLLGPTHAEWCRKVQRNIEAEHGIESELSGQEFADQYEIQGQCLLRRIEREADDAVTLKRGLFNGASIPGKLADQEREEVAALVKRALPQVKMALAQTLQLLRQLSVAQRSPESVMSTLEEFPRLCHVIISETLERFSRVGALRERIEEHTGALHADLETLLGRTAQPSYLTDVMVSETLAQLRREIDGVSEQLSAPWQRRIQSQIATMTSAVSVAVGKRSSALRGFPQLVNQLNEATARASARLDEAYELLFSVVQVSTQAICTLSAEADAVLHSLEPLCYSSTCGLGHRIQCYSPSCVRAQLREKLAQKLSLGSRPISAVSSPSPRKVQMGMSPPSTPESHSTPRGVRRAMSTLTERALNSPSPQRRSRSFGAGTFEPPRSPTMERLLWNNQLRRRAMSPIHGRSPNRSTAASTGSEPTQDMRVYNLIRTHFPNSQPARVDMDTYAFADTKIVVRSLHGHLLANNKGSWEPIASCLARLKKSCS
eukprot:m.159174 g.159174  ORF g.159174 m.159174 type:complete len:2800 (+) comp10256_c0_seq1:30-8429(+)